MSPPIVAPKLFEQQAFILDALAKASSVGSMNVDASDPSDAASVPESGQDKVGADCADSDSASEVPETEASEAGKQTVRAELANGIAQFIEHTKAGSFQCTICKRDFVWQNSLVRHITCVHAGIKKFQCARCGKAFKGRHGLKYHIDANSCLKSKGAVLPTSRVVAGAARKRTPVLCKTGSAKDASGNYPCNICGKSFAMYKIMTRHIKTVHESVGAFKCGLCPKAFKSKQGLQYHAERAHPSADQASLDSNSGNLLRTGSTGSQNSLSSMLNLTSLHPSGAVQFSSTPSMVSLPPGLSQSGPHGIAQHPNVMQPGGQLMTAAQFLQLNAQLLQQQEQEQVRHQQMKLQQQQELRQQQQKQQELREQHQQLQLQLLGSAFNQGHQIHEPTQVPNLLLPFLTGQSTQGALQQRFALSQQFLQGGAGPSFDDPSDRAERLAAFALSTKALPSHLGYLFDPSRAGL